MAIIKTYANKFWGRCGEKGTLRTVWSLLKKLKIELPYDPAIPLLGIHPENMKTLLQKDIYLSIYSIYSSSSIYNSQDMEATYISTDAGRDWGQEEKGTTEDEVAGWHH